MCLILIDFHNGSNIPSIPSERRKLGQSLQLQRERRAVLHSQERRNPHTSEPHQQRHQSDSDWKQHDWRITSSQPSITSDHTGLPLYQQLQRLQRPRSIPTDLNRLRLVQQHPQCRVSPRRLQQALPRQCCHAETSPHPWATSSCLWRVWKSLC